VRHISFARDKQNVTAHTFFCLEEDKSHVNGPRPDLLVSGGAQPDWSFRGRTEVVKNGVRNLGQQVLEGRPGEHLVERIDRQVLELLHLPEIVGTAHEEFTEGAGVDESEVAALLEREDHMGVRGHRHAARPPEEPAAHPEVRHQHVAGVEREQLLADLRAARG